MAQAPMAMAGGAACLAGAYFVYDQYVKVQATQATPSADMLNNRAFVFVKPHAATDETAAFVRDAIKKKGFTIHKEGDITSTEIDEQKLIDQHYYAIASKATILKPEQMNIPADKFEQAFGKSWETVLKENKAFNALDACKELNVDADKINKLWAEAKKNNKLVKLGGGFYCGEINANGKTLYIFNGFFMEMRKAFTAPGKKIHYYDVEWDPRIMTWSDFRNKFLGPTDPKDAPAESLRGQVLRDWKNLGLKSEPNVGDNAVHASASPFEGMAERMNWMGVQCKQDDYCIALLKAGLPESLIKEWTRDPQVVISADKKKKSLFDSLEDKDAKDCLQSAKELAKFA